MRQVTHALLTRPPLSHQIFHSEEIRIRCFVRLACVKHAASVHPEPGSNSLNKCLLQVKINSWLIYPFYCFLRIFRSFVFMILKRTFEECVSLFSYQRSVLHCRLSQTALLLYHVVSCLSRTFSTFLKLFLLLSCSNFGSISCLPLSCQELFSRNFSVSTERRRRDLNPRAATNDLLPFQGSPFSHLGTSPNA